MGTQVTRVDEDGVVVTPGFSMEQYLAGVTSPRSFEQQQQLAAAYDAACRALIGPNDVQVEGKREFKKKSAWRKLARHFGISVEADVNDARIQATPSGDGFLAIASATAIAPWGQRVTEVGACSSDEAVGRRVITIADAIATAMTRATSRAVSNLIAMGEVSADEVRKGHGGEVEPPVELTDEHRRQAAFLLKLGWTPAQRGYWLDRLAQADGAGDADAYLKALEGMLRKANELRLFAGERPMTARDVMEAAAQDAAEPPVPASGAEAPSDGVQGLDGGGAAAPEGGKEGE